MKKILAAMACVLFFIGCVLVQAPAWLLTEALGDRVRGLQLGAVSGSVWQGRLDKMAFNGVVLSGIDWQLRPLGLVSGRALSLNIQQPLKARADLGLKGANQVKIFDLSAGGEFEPLLDAAGLPTMGFNGRFSGELSTAVVGPQGCETIAGKVVLESISGDIDGIDTIAPVSAELSCSNQQLIVTIDGNNPAKVRGVLQVSAQGRPRGNVQISPAPNSPLFRSLSQFVGRPRNGQDFQLRL